MWCLSLPGGRAGGLAGKDGSAILATAAEVLDAGVTGKVDIFLVDRLISCEGCEQRGLVAPMLRTGRTDESPAKQLLCSNRN